MRKRCLISFLNSNSNKFILKEPHDHHVVQESNTGRKTDCSKSNISRYFVTVLLVIKLY